MSKLTAPRHLTPPKAAARPTEVVRHGVAVGDDYAWLRDAGYPDVTNEEILDHLKAENAYFESVMKPYGDLTDIIFDEIKSRIKEDDAGVPWQDGDFDYHWAFAKGAQYRTWYYRPRSADPLALEGYEVLYDETREAEGLAFFALRQLAMSPNGKIRASSTDKTGGERFTIEFYDLAQGVALPLTIPETSGEIVWDAAGKGVFYVEVSPEWRPFRVLYQALDGGPAVEVYHEANDQFFVHIGTGGPRTQLVISSSTHITSEVYLLPRATPEGTPVCIAPRREGHDYSIQEARDTQGGMCLYILSNREAVNFGLYVSDYISAGEAAWRPLRMGNADRYVRGFLAQADRLIVEESNQGRKDLVLLDTDGSESDTVAFAEEVRSVGLGHNPEYDADFVRLGYTSLTTPASVFDLAPHSGDLTLRKEQEIPAGYDRKAYKSERLMVEVRDGVRVPVSLVYPADWQKGSDAPLHLYGYGAYGLGMDPGFSVSRLSLLDRGFAYAIAHVRGGDELGYDWYLSGKLAARENTFNDFVDVARHLIAEGYVKTGRLTTSGGSAGGELMGAVVNQAGDLFAGAVLHVPFVDVLNTMCDASLPLTPMEWPEWGNPLEDADAFKTIHAYCPYTNIEAKEYPPMMVTGGLNDPRVTYWEPAKWTAKLRATKSDNNLLIQKINMGAGHAGKSGRFERIRETAEEYVFCLMVTGLV